jgi:hypothetical protein
MWVACSQKKRANRLPQRNVRTNRHFGEATSSSPRAAQAGTQRPGNLAKALDSSLRWNDGRRFVHIFPKAKAAMAAFRARA